VPGSELYEESRAQVIGRREERHVDALAGDRLVLSEQWSQSGRRLNGVRVFRRLPDRDITNRCRRGRLAE